MENKPHLQGPCFSRDQNFLKESDNKEDFSNFQAIQGKEVPPIKPLFFQGSKFLEEIR